MESGNNNKARLHKQDEYWSQILKRKAAWEYISHIDDAILKY